MTTTGLDYLPKPILRRPSGDNLSCGNSCASSQRRVRIDSGSSSLKSAKSAMSSALSVENDIDARTESTSPSCEEGYESDATEVTSNTGTESKPSPTTPTTCRPTRTRPDFNSPHVRRGTRGYRGASTASSCQSSRTSKKSCTCGGATKGGRWDSGTSKCTCKGSTASPTSLVAAIKSGLQDSMHGVAQKSPTCVTKSHSSVEDKQDKGDCSNIAPVPDLLCEDHDLDLKSKPGIIEVELEDEDELDEDDDDGEHGLLQDRSAAGSCAKSTTSARSKSSHSSSYTPLTDVRVRTFLKDYYEDFDSVFRLGKSNSSIWDAFFKQYYTEDILWVRSSSNTLKGPELADHFANHIVGIQMCLVSIDSIQILPGGMTAVVVYTADQEFLYNGHPVADRSVLSTVLHLHLDDNSSSECQERILISHEHRCTGKPIPTKKNRWETTPRE